MDRGYRAGERVFGMGKDLARMGKACLPGFSRCLLAWRESGA